MNKECGFHQSNYFALNEIQYDLCVRYLVIDQLNVYAINFHFHRVLPDDDGKRIVHLSKSDKLQITGNKIF